MVIDGERGGDAVREAVRARSCRTCCVLVRGLDFFERIMRSHWRILCDFDLIFMFFYL